MKRSVKLYRLLPLILILLSQVANAAPSAGVAGLASIIPGLGQVIDNEPLEGLGWFTTVVGLELISSRVPIYTEPVASSKQGLTAQAAYDLWLYNMYDAYRDARPSGGRYANDSALGNYVATFNPINLWDPITTPALGLWTAGSTYSNAAKIGRPFFFGFVGMGEEGLFRGFLFPSLSETFNSKIMGAISSSVLFSLFHITNGVADMESNFVQRFFMGTIFCWAADRNKYNLKDGILAHSWIDVINENGFGKTAVSQIKWNIPF